MKWKDISLISPQYLLMDQTRNKEIGSGQGIDGEEEIRYISIETQEAKCRQLKSQTCSPKSDLRKSTLFNWLVTQN